MSELTAPAPQPRGSLSQVWWPFFLAALVLLVAEVAVRKVPLPEAWLARWTRWRGLRQDEALPEHTYDALRAGVAQEAARPPAAMRDGLPLDANDPAARARLFMAAGRRR